MWLRLEFFKKEIVLNRLMLNPSLRGRIIGWINLLYQHACNPWVMATVIDHMALLVITKMGTFHHQKKRVCWGSYSDFLLQSKKETLYYN